jgi:predicted component of type VI protein secretion system
MIIDVLSKFEPRIQIIDVTVTTTNTGYRVLIDFYIIGSDQPVQVSTLLTRTL